MEDFTSLDLQQNTVVPAGLPLPQLSPPLPSHRPSPTYMLSCHCSSHNCKRCLLPKTTTLGFGFCLATDSKAKLLHLTSQTPLQHTASTALELTVHNQRNSAKSPPVPRPQHCRSHRRSAAYPPSPRIKPALLQLSPSHPICLSKDVDSKHTWIKCELKLLWPPTICLSQQG